MTKKITIFSLLGLTVIALGLFMLLPMSSAEVITDDDELCIQIMNGRVYRIGYWGNKKNMAMMEEIRGTLEDYAMKTLLYSDLSEQEKLIWDYYNTVNDRSIHPDGNWEKRLELTEPRNRQNHYNFSTYHGNREKRLGIFNVKSASIVYIKQIETGSTDQERYPGDEMQTFVVGIDCTVYNDGDFYSNGLNWNIMPLVNIDDTWYVTYVGAPNGWTWEYVITRWGEWKE